MAKAAEPRPRTLSVVFGAYFLFVILLAYLFASTVAPYVDPGATFWILAAYVLLGAVALVGICAGAVRRAGRLDSQLDDLEGLYALHRTQRDVYAAGEDPLPPNGPVVVDSGSPELEVEVLLDNLREIGDAVTAEEAAAGNPELTLTEIESVLRADAREIERTRSARDAIAMTLVGPAIAAIAVVGAFAPLLPASDGMLVANLGLNAFVGVAGIGCLAGLAAYLSAAFHQLGVRAGF